MGANLGAAIHNSSISLITKLRVPGVLFSVFVLTGCSVLYPELKMIQIDVSATTSHEKSDALLGKARVLLEYYGENYNKSAQSVDLSTLPIVAAGAAAAGALLFDAGTSAVTAIGLGAGTYTVGRTVLLPTDLPELYLRGYSATSCVIARGSVFAAEPSGAGQSLGRLVGKLSDAQQLVGAADRVVIGSSSPPSGFEEARRTLTNEITESENAVDSAEGQLTAFQGGPFLLETTLQNIQYRVAQKAREGRVISFADALSAISETAREETKYSEDQRPPEKFTTKNVVARLLDKANSLRAQRRQLARLLPDFATAADQLKKCPDVI